MRDSKCASVLLHAAARHIVVLHALDSSPIMVSDELFEFHVQQATEKLLNAWLALLGETFPVTHSIATLVESLETRASTVSEIELFRDLIKFHPFAVRHRYEALESDTEPFDREDAVQ